MHSIAARLKRWRGRSFEQLHPFQVPPGLQSSCPEEMRCLPVPGDGGLGSHDDQILPPPGEAVENERPDGPVPRSQGKQYGLRREEDTELMAKVQVLGHEGGPRASRTRRDIASKTPAPPPVGLVEGLEAEIGNQPSRRVTVQRQPTASSSPARCPPGRTPASTGSRDPTPTRSSRRGRSSACRRGRSAKPRSRRSSTRP